ncbi:MAG TPA: rod shape-determining protein MreD, partial [Ruminococcaceae bacterium]|nr:rod shape-determining protein MreD [Oscillospiraceae bacterium]
LGYSIEILVLFVLQETPGLIPEIGGARPVMLIPAAVCIAMFESETPAMAFG